MALKFDDDLKDVKRETKVEAPAKEAPAAEAPVEAPAAPVEIPEVPEDLLESMSDKIEFIASLGDPSNDDVTTKKQPDGTEQKVVTPTIVGYQFKALEDMEIPDCGLTIGFKKDAMNYDPEKMQNKRMAKAGEIINLTPFETALLLSPPEFNGKVCGGDKVLYLVYNQKSLRRKDGTLNTVSDATRFPRAALRAEKGKSVRDYPIVNVLTYEDAVAPNGSKIKNRTIIAGFEKWDVLCQKSVRTSAGGSGRTSKADGRKQYHDGASVFMSIYNAKTAKGNK